MTGDTTLQDWFHIQHHPKTIVVLLGIESHLGAHTIDARVVVNGGMSCQLLFQLFDIDGIWDPLVI